MSHKPGTDLTQLMLASAMGNVEVVRELIERGADINQRGPRKSTALMFAAGGGHLEIVKVLVERGADIFAAEDGGWTAMRLAEEDGEDAIYDYLSKVAETQTH